MRISYTVADGLGPFETVENEKSRAAALFFHGFFLKKREKTFIMIKKIYGKENKKVI